MEWVATPTSNLPCSSLKQMHRQENPHSQGSPVITPPPLNIYTPGPGGIWEYHLLTSYFPPFLFPRTTNHLSQGLQGTGVVISQCCEQSPHSIWKHSIVFITSPVQELRVVTDYIPVSFGTKLETQVLKEKCPQGLEEERDLHVQISRCEALQGDAWICCTFKRC